MPRPQTQKLRRDELLEMLLELEQENEELATRNRELRERLSSREIKIAEAGSIAEAAVRLTGVLEAAQRAADLYVENTRRTADEALARTRELCVGYARKTERLAGTIEGASLVAEVEALFDDARDEGRSA